MGRSKVDFDAECPRVGTAVVGMDILQVDVIAVTELHGEEKYPFVSMVPNKFGCDSRLTTFRVIDLGMFMRPH